MKISDSEESMDVLFLRAIMKALVRSFGHRSVIQEALRLYEVKPNKKTKKPDLGEGDIQGARQSKTDQMAKDKEEFD
jgi:hypothetical protein